MVLLGCLVGRLLRYVAVNDSVRRGQSEPASNLILFKETTNGKPYLEAPSTSPSIGFNLSHDSNLVLLAVRGHRNLISARDIGVDVMRVTVPEGQTFLSFLESISIILTTQEFDHLVTLASRNIEDAINGLFKLWTIKEAYTKALGIGLKFEMTRLEYDFTANVLKLDGQPLRLWRIHTLNFGVENCEEEQTYMGAICWREDEDDMDSGGLVVSGDGLKTIKMDVEALIERMKELSPYSTR